MIYSYDAYKRMDRPFTYLATPNKDYIGTIQSRDLRTPLCFNNISEASFKVNKYEDGKLTSYYDKIAELMLVELTYIGWFQITDIERVGNGNNEYINVTTLSLENEGCSKTLTSFGQLGVETDDDGGLDRYCLHSLTDTNHSILHIWQKKMPSWTIGYIDPAITKEYRTFTEDEVDAYSFLTGKVSETFECIFQFDTFEQTVSAYRLENIGDVTSIYLSYDNLVKTTKIKSNTSDIKTVLTVSGGDDQGTPLGIIEVNPSGSNQISNFSFYKPLMSAPLQLKLDAYQIEYNNRLNNFTPAVDRLQTLLKELGVLNTKLPDVVTSTNWVEYGLAELNTKYNYYNERMALYIGKTDSTSLTNYNSNRVFRDAVEAELKIRRSQITIKETEIVNQEILCKSLTLDIETYLGVELYKELSRYCHYDTFVDDTFVVTSAMTDAEALDMKRELLKMAQDKLEKKCKPQYSIEVDAINFTAIPEFKSYSDQLYLGNIMTLDFGDDILVESRLLKLDINWDKPDEFSMTFSSKNKLDGFEYEFAEIQSQANAAGTAYGISGTGWNNAKNKTSTYDQYMNSTLDLTKQNLQNSTNQEFLINSTGALMRRWDDAKNDYSPNQLWLTNNIIAMSSNSFKNVSLCIGEIEMNGANMYGVVADAIVGKLMLTSKLIVENANSSIVLNENGATFKDCDITINKGTNTLKLNAADGIKLTNNGINQFYIDGSGNATFSGNLNAATGTFSGELKAASGSFTGSINVNNKFVVDSNGNATIGGYATSSQLNSVASTANDASSTANSLYYGLANGSTTINGGCITTGTINAKFVTGGTLTGVVIKSVGSNADLRIEDGNILINGYNGYLRGTNSSSGSSYSKIIGISVNGNIVIGHDDATPSVYGGSRTPVNMYTNSLNIQGNSSGASSSVSINGSLTCSSLTTENISMGGYSVLTTDTGAAKNHTHTGYANSSHMHSSLDINPSLTGSQNINFPGGINGASVTWCNNTFETKTGSDIRIKKNIKPLSELPEELFLSLKPKQYEFKCETSAKGINFGLISQQVECAFTSFGLDYGDYNLLELADVKTYTDEGFYVSDKIHRINYNNLISWNIQITQNLYKRVSDLEKIILDLKQQK